MGARRTTRDSQERADRLPFAAEGRFPVGRQRTGTRRLMSRVWKLKISRTC